MLQQLSLYQPLIEPSLPALWVNYASGSAPMQSKRIKTTLQGLEFPLNKTQGLFVWFRHFPEQFEQKIAYTRRSILSSVLDVGSTPTVSTKIQDALAVSCILVQVFRTVVIGVLLWICLILGQQRQVYSVEIYRTILALLS